jgi:hypothetical protein
LREEATGRADSDFVEGWLLLLREFEFAVDAGAEFVFEFAAIEESEDGGRFAVAGAVGFSVAGEEALDLAESGRENREDRRIKRGRKTMASRTAAAALTRKSLLDRGDGLGEMTRRELPMVALTCGSDETGTDSRAG